MTAILVAAFGNLTAGDDALGPAVLAYLQRGDRTGLRLLDAAAAPTGLLDALPAPQGLILVDAIMDPALTPGQVVDVDWNDTARPSLAADATLSTHGFSLTQQMDMARVLDLLPPRIRLVGVGIAQAALGEPLSPAVRAAVPEAAGRIRHWAARWAADGR